MDIGLTAMKRTNLATWTLMCSIACAAPAAAQNDSEEGPFVLKEFTLVCASPDAYTTGVAAVSTASDRRAARKKLLDDKQCMTIDDDAIEDMLPPFVKVQEADGDWAKVRFTVEHYKRIHFLHRRFAHVTYEGWTHKERIIPRSDLGKKG